MVKGLDVFRRFFSDFRDCYVLIGGSACDVYFADQELAFRVTHDLDVILCVEALTPAFFDRFWEFIRTGGYANRQRSDGHRQFYRFTKPTKAGYPAMLELFSRKADFLSGDEHVRRLTPIPADAEVPSLSGILLDRLYYDFVMANRREVDGVTILNPIALIVLKAVAWLNLADQRTAGDSHASSRDISKHKNDIARIAATLGVRDYGLPVEVKARMREFMLRYKNEPLDPSALGLALDADDIKARLFACLGIG